MIQGTKGYFRLKGKIWGLNNKEPRSNSATRTLSFGLQTSKENSIFVQIGEWKNTVLTAKIKGHEMDSVEELNEQEALDKIREVFKDGDSVYINCRSQVSLYGKRLDYFINQIYIENEPIDFDSPEFEEVNELNQSVIIVEKPNSTSVKVGMTTYKGEMIEQELSLSDPDVKDYFFENVKVGDLMRLTLAVKNIPIYEGEGEATERKTLKGKQIKSGGKKIVDRKHIIEVVDVDIDATKVKEYDREDIRKALELAEEQPVKNESTKVESKVQENDLPY